MDNSEEEIYSLIKKLAKSIRKHGVSKVVSALNEINSEEAYAEAHSEIVSFIIKQTADSFMVSPEDMKKKNIRGVIFDARSMCFVLLKKHLDWSHEDIASIFGKKNHTLVSHALRDFTEKDVNIKSHKKFIDIYTELDKKIEDRKGLVFLKHVG